MDIAILIDKLTNIELSIGRESNIAVRHKVIALQDWLLQVQKERAERPHVERRVDDGQVASDSSSHSDWNIEVPWHLAAYPILRRAS